MNKRKVETLSGVVPTKRKKIIDYLVAHPEGATPKMISFATSINVNTVKSILPKIENINSFTRGWYKVVNQGDIPSISDGTLTAWNFHNLILSFPVETVSLYKFTRDFGLIKLHFIINSKNVCTCRLSSDYPLNVSSIVMVYAYIDELFLGAKLSMSDVNIKSIEFNKDYSNLKFEGVNCITLDSL